MKVHLKAHGVELEFEGSADECSRAVSVWYAAALAEIRARHGDLNEADRQLKQLIDQALKQAAEAAATGKVH